MFVFLVTAGVTLLAVPAAWLTAWLMSGKTPSPLVIGVGIVVGLLVGVIAGSRFWDDRQAIRQRIAEDSEDADQAI